MLQKDLREEMDVCGEEDGFWIFPNERPFEPKWFEFKAFKNNQNDVLHQ